MELLYVGTVLLYGATVYDFLVNVQIYLYICVENFRTQPVIKNSLKHFI